MKELDRRLEGDGPGHPAHVVRVDEEKKVVDRTRPSGRPNRSAAASSAGCRRSGSPAKAAPARTATTWTTIGLTGWRFKPCHSDKDARAAAAAASGGDKKAGRQGKGPAPPDVPPPQGLQVLRGQDRRHQLQGRQADRRRSCPSAARFCRGAFPAPARCTSASCRRRSSARGRSRYSVRHGLSEERIDGSHSAENTSTTSARRGEIVKVADGYARNYLLPRKLALLVTDGNKKQIERERGKFEAKEAEERRSPRRSPSAWATSKSKSRARSARRRRCSGR